MTSDPSWSVDRATGFKPQSPPDFNGESHERGTVVG
jgi:hypothetical protein